MWWGVTYPSQDIDIDIDIDVDVIIVGAGISGLGAAYRLNKRNPHIDLHHRRAASNRSAVRGICSATRGVRSDSSMFTLSFPWEPWTRKEGVADAEHIREYLTATAHKYGIDRHIQFNSYVLARRTGIPPPTPWAVTVEHNGAAQALPQPVPVLRQRLLQLRRGLHPGLPRHRTVRRHGYTSAALAGRPGLHRKEDRGDRQRRHRGHADPVADRPGRKGDHAAAFTDLHDGGIQVRQVRCGRT